MADDCASLARELALLRQQIASIRIPDENALRTSIKSSLQPDIATAVAGGVAVLANRLDPQIQGLINSLNNKDQRIGAAEKLAAEAKAATDAAARQKYATKSELELEVMNRQYGDNLHEQGYSKAKIDQMLADKELAASLREAKAQQQLQSEYRNLVRAEQARASVAESNAVTKAAEAGEKALNTANEVTGLKGLVTGFSSKIAAIETKIGNALITAAKAIGISEQALLATGKLAGRIIEIFNIIGTFAVLIEQLTTLNILGGRIDAVESAVDAIGASVSGVLGKLLGLQGRIANNEATISSVRGIAIDAKGIGEAANLKAGAAQVTASRAEGYATTAQAKAVQAQTTADGAVRNAKQANDNATTAYQKAAQAETIGQQAKRLALDALGKAGTALTTALTAIALYQTVKGLRGLKGDKGDRGIPGIQGIPGIKGLPGVTTVVTLPGQKGDKGDKGETGRPGVGIPGRPGKDAINGRDGKDVNPADLASLRALIISQHASTRANINTTSTGLVNGVKTFFTSQLAGITTLITAIANNTYIEKALAVLTFAATIHNAFILSNNLAQTLGTVIDQCLSLIVPKGIDGQPISIGNVLGKVAHEIIADTIGEANYTKITEEWALANRIYQATTNVFNTVGNAVATISAGMEVIGGNVAKIGNALKIWGVLGEKAYSWMNPQPNLQGKFFNFMTGATDALNTIQAVIAVPLAITQAVIEVNSARTALQASLNQEDPKDKNGHPIVDALGNPLKYEPGVTVPDPTKTVLAQEQATEDSTNFLVATVDDLFDGGD